MATMHGKVFRREVDPMSTSEGGFDAVLHGPSARPRPWLSPFQLLLQMHPGPESTATRLRQRDLQNPRWNNWYRSRILRSARQFFFLQLKGAQPPGEQLHSALQ